MVYCCHFRLFLLSGKCCFLLPDLSLRLLTVLIELTKPAENLCHLKSKIQHTLSRWRNRIGPGVKVSTKKWVGTAGLGGRNVNRETGKKSELNVSDMCQLLDGLGCFIEHSLLFRQSLPFFILIFISGGIVDEFKKECGEFRVGSAASLHIFIAVLLLLRFLSE